MNTRIISYVISNLFKLMMALFLFPLVVSIYYKEGLKLSMAYIIPIIILCVLSYFLSGKSPENQSFFSKEGLVLVTYIIFWSFTFCNKWRNSKYDRCFF